MTVRLTVVDAFADRPFAGNPAAVTVADAFPAEELMQAVACEMNLSETCFVVPRADGDFDLRWFTPTTEVDLCGHATLAAAHVLGGTARFHTRSGALECAPVGDGWIGMDLPADSPEETDPASGTGLGLGEVLWFGRGRSSFLARLSAATDVRSLTPDLGAVAGLPARGLIVTAPGDRPGLDCVSRYFAPQSGIPEDPVTGSAHCTLAEFWGGRLGIDALTGEQASARGGIVRMHRRGDRVTVSGRAVTTAEVRLVAGVA